MTVSPDQVRAGYYWDVVRRQWLILVFFAGVGLALAALYLYLVPPQATAKTTINLSVITTDPFGATRSASGLVDGPTEQRVAASNAVAVLAAANVGGGVTPQEMRDRVSANVIADATILEIAYTGPTAEVAQRGANAFADAYLSYRTKEAVDKVQRAVKVVEDEVATLRPTLNDANARLASAPANSLGAIQAAAERDEVLASIRSLHSRREQLLAVDTTGGQILTRADQNPVIVTPGSKLVLASGLLGGAVLGFLMAFGLDRARSKRATSAARASDEPTQPEKANVDPIHRGGPDPEVGPDEGEATRMSAGGAAVTDADEEPRRGQVIGSGR